MASFMATSLLVVGCRQPWSPLQPRPQLSPIRHSLRLKKLSDLQGQAKQRVPVVCASNITPPNQDAGKGKASSSRSSSAADGPPLLTILAGVLVFLLVCWALGSIAIWLINLIVNVPPS